MKRILITCTALALLGTALLASRHGETVTNDLTVRIDDALHDLESVHAPIPHAALHAKALEILQGRIVAKDNGDDSGLVKANAAACVAFEKAPMDRVNCAKEGAR